MSRFARSLIAGSIALLTTIANGGCGSDPGDAIVRVGDSAITKSAFEHWLSAGEIGSVEPQAPSRNPSTRMTPKQRMILDFLISAERTIGEAREDGIEVTHSEVNAVFEGVLFERTHGLRVTPLPEPQSSLFDRVKQRSDKAWIIKVNMLAGKVAQRRLSQAEQRITHSQIVDYYHKNKNQFVAAERRDVAVIQAFRKATADIARREIESGRSLLSVVERRNDEPSVGGLKRGLTRRALRHDYEKNYFSARPHVLVGPLKAEIYYLFEVTAIIPARQQEIAEVQTVIRRKLVAGTQRRVLTNLVRMLDEKWRARTRCRAAYVVAQCGSALK